MEWFIIIVFSILLFTLAIERSNNHSQLPINPSAKQGESSNYMMGDNRYTNSGSNYELETLEITIRAFFCCFSVRNYVTRWIFRKHPILERDWHMLDIGKPVNNRSNFKIKSLNYVIMGDCTRGGGRIFEKNYYMVTWDLRNIYVAYCSLFVLFCRHIDSKRIQRYEC